MILALFWTIQMQLLLHPIQRQNLLAQHHGRYVDSLQSVQQIPGIAVLVRSVASSPVNDVQQVYRNDFVLTTSIMAALRDRCNETTRVIMVELKEILIKHVWNGVHTRGTSKKQRSAITRSYVFLNEKYLDFDAFERFKARLVAGNNKQDKDKTVQRSILAFGNADMTGVEVHIRLNRVMTSMVMQLDPSYEKYRELDATVVVRLDKVIYKCVEVSLL